MTIHDISYDYISLSWNLTTPLLPVSRFLQEDQVDSLTRITFNDVIIINSIIRMNILEIRASARTSGSLSRMLADGLIESLKNKGVDFEIKSRDVGLHPPTVVNEAWIAAAFAKKERDDEQQRLLRESDGYIEELRWADVIVIATPMYNYGMPSSLKAWFDQVIRINETFTFDLSRGDFPLEPIMKEKMLLLFTSSGEFGFEDGGIRSGQDHLVPHVKTCAKYLGVNVEDSFYHIGIEYQEFRDARHAESISAAKESVAALADHLIVQFSKCFSS